MMLVLKPKIFKGRQEGFTLTSAVRRKYGLIYIKSGCRIILRLVRIASIQWTYVYKGE